MTIKIYADSDAHAVFIENSNGVQFLNSLQATLDEPSGDYISISDLARDVHIFSSVHYAEFVNESGDDYGADAAEVCNALNAAFTASGDVEQVPPEITSSLSLSLTSGQTLNYELVATRGVGYEWDFSSVPGVVNVEGNARKIIGGSGLAAGTYTIPVKAINYNGEDSREITLTVSNPPYNNTKSVFFRQNDWCSVTSTTANPLYRANQNAATPWAVSFWFKSGTSNNQNQTIISYGGSDTNNDGRVQIKYNGNNGTRRRMYLVYGTNNNNLSIFSPVGSVVANTWAHWLFTYDGGSTENGSGGIADSYSRFKIYKNGVLQTPANTNSNYGFSAEIKSEHFRIARQSGGGQYMRNCNLDELAIWDTDESGNAASIYNSGATHDLELLTSAPSHYWRMGDDDTFPTLSDVIGGLDATMWGMSVSDIVSEVP